MSERRSLRDMIFEEVWVRGETWENIISMTLSEVELDADLSTGTDRLPFTAWSENFVYFPVGYDDKNWCGSVPRHPNGQPTPYQGG